MKTFLVLLCLISKLMAGVHKKNENCVCVAEKTCGADDCGRCVENFDFWNRKIENFKNVTKFHSNTTNFDGIFIEINRQLETIKNLLKGTDKVVLNSEENFQKIQQRFNAVEKLINTTQDLLRKLENDAHYGGIKIDENTHKLEMYKQKLKQLSSDIKKLEEKSVKGSLNKINVILKKMKILSQAVPENNTNLCTEELKNLKNDLEDLRKINNNATNINKIIFSTNLPSESLEQLEKQQNQTENKLNVKNEQIEKIVQYALSLNILTIKNTCQNILNVTNDTLQNSLKILNTTKLTNDIKTALKQKQPNLKDFEDTMKNILAKNVILKPVQIEELKNTLLKIIESDQNPFTENDVRRLEKENESIAAKINLLYKYGLFDNINKTLAKLDEIKKSQKNLDEKINETISTVNNFDSSFKKFQQNFNGVQKGLEKTEEKLKNLNDSTFFFDAIRDASSITKLIESDANNLLGEYEKLMKNFEEQNNEFEKRRAELHERMYGEKRGVRLDELLLRGSRLKNYPSTIGHKKLLNDIEILSQRLNDYLIAIERGAVENNNC